MATQALLSISKDEEMQMKALSEEKRLRDYNMDKNSWINSGVERGRKEGIKVGIQRGLETGRKEGREEGRKEIIEKMRAQGFSEEQIKSIIE